MAVAACFSGVALANPTNPTVVNGTATFAQAGNVLNITNSHNAIINWGSFSIGVNELTRFIQPSALSAVLNRVVGQDPSAILGALQSNGRVFLLNPNGIVFGAGAQINVAGLVASTLNLSNADFLAGRMNFTDGAGAGSVLNQGAINAAGGPVYMVGNAVTNQGIITSPGGEIVLAAGNSVELVNPGTPNLRVEIQAGDNEARNLGSVVADAGRIGIYAGLIKQGGVVNADSVVSEGGRIMLKSTRSTTLEAGSVTSARGTSGGEIIVLSGMTDGVTHVAGKLDASATVGDGGFIETSASRVKIADSAIVRARGGPAGKKGQWLIDPYDFYIASYGGDISGYALSTLLDDDLGGGMDVTISTVTGVNLGGPGATSGLGNIYINDLVDWQNSSTLTLTAENDILFGVASGSIALDGGTTGHVVLNAGNRILTNNQIYSGGYDVRAASLTATAANGIGADYYGWPSYPLRTSVASLNLTNTTNGDIYVSNDRALTNINAVNTGSAAYGGNIFINNYDSFTVNSGSALSATNQIRVYAPHIDIRGNVSAGSHINLDAPSVSSLIVGSGANVTSTNGDVYMYSNNINLDGAGVIKGNSIYLGDYCCGTLDIGINPSTSNQTISPGSFAKLELNDPASGAVVVEASYGLNVNAPITLAPARAETLELRAGSGISQTASGAISVKKLYADGGEGGVRLNAANNMVGILAGYAGNSDPEFRFRNVGNLEIGMVGANNGIAVDASPYFYASALDATIDIQVDSGNLTVKGPISLYSSGVGSTWDGETWTYFNTDSQINLRATSGKIDVLNSASVVVDGGEGRAILDVQASGNVTVANSAELRAVNNYYSLGEAAVYLESYNGNVSVIDSGVVKAESGIDARVIVHSGAGGVTINSPQGLIAESNNDYGTATVSVDTSGPLHVGMNGFVEARTYGWAGSSAVYLSATGAMTIDGTVAATNYGPYGNAGASLYSGSTMTVNGTVRVDGGEGSAQVDLDAVGNIVLNDGASVTAYSDPLYGYQALVVVNSTGGSIHQNATVRADGGEGTHIAMRALNGAITQSGASGLLSVTGNSGYGGDPYVSLEARAGIGTLASPLRIDGSSDPEIYAYNSGPAGDIALSFSNTSDLYSAVTGRFGINIDGDLNGLRNDNPNGTYLVRSDTNINLVIPFRPDGADLLPGQSVVLDAPSGDIFIGPQMIGSEMGSIKAGAGAGTGNVHLLAAGTVTIGAGSYITGNEPIIKANDIDMQGFVRSGNGFINILHQADGPIHLGYAGVGAGGALALDNDELNLMTGWDGIDPMTGSGGGLVIGNTTGGDIVFKGPVQSSAFLNVRGASVSQDSGAIITGGLNIYTEGAVTLTEANQLDSLSVGTNGGAVTVASAAPLFISGIETLGGNVNISTTGAMTFNSGISAASGNVVLAAASISDAHTGVDVVANALTLNVPGSIGSLANPLETSVLQLSVNSMGGSAQEVGILNGGNLSLQSLAFNGSFASIGTTGAMTVDSSFNAAGNVALLANNGLTVNGSLVSAQSMSLNSGAGTLLMDGGANSAHAASTLGLSGANILLDNGASAHGDAGTTATAAGNLTVRAGSSLGGGSITNVAAGGTVLVDRANIYGDPDVIITSGAGINLNGTAFEPGRINAASPNTIIVNFPLLASGGYSVNGIQGALYDALTGSGFFANGNPAELGSTMLVTYGGAPSSIAAPTDTLIVAMASAIKAPEPAKGGTTAEDEKELKKKDAPVCR